MNIPTSEEIKAIRLKTALTQTQAAALVHCTKSGWQRWEYGQRKMPLAVWELFLGKIEHAS